MKITNVEVLVLKSPGLYNRPAGSEEPQGPTYMGLVRVPPDAGITGYSDMETSAPVAKAAVEAPSWSEPGNECFEGLASLIVGENPLEPERLWYKMYRGSIYYGRRGVAIQAISAIDIALWDIMGKFYGQPVCMLLGAKWRDRVRAYASTLFRPTPEAMREAARGYLDQGFTAIKFGWGVFGEDAGRDVRLVEAARTEIGDRIDLLIDTGWFVERTPKQAIQVARSLEPYRPFFIEELLHPEDYDGYRRVAEDAHRLRRAGGYRVGFSRAHRARQGRYPATRFDALRRIYRRAQDRAHGRTGERARDPALVVFRFVDRRLSAPECVSAPGGLHRIQHLARTAQP